MGSCMSDGGNHSHQAAHLVREVDVLEEFRPIDAKVKEEGLKMTGIPTREPDVMGSYGFIVPVTHFTLWQSNMAIKHGNGNPL